MALDISAFSPQLVRGNDTNSAVGRALAELRDHLRTAGASGLTPILVEAGAGERDGFAVDTSPDEVRIRGENARGALNGAYWLLEQLGWAWVEPGEDGAVFAPGAALEQGEHRQAPAFARRTLILGQDALHDDWPAWLEWASRNRYNDVFFHDTPPSLWDRAGKQRPTDQHELDVDQRGWMFERWEADGPQIVAAAHERGMTLQFGGHHLPTLVPREEFEHHPDWFPLRRGVREQRYNICTATAALRDYLARRVEAFLGRFPGADIYHFWADDIRGGGWCDCEQGCGTSPSDQALLATNLVAETVARVLPRALVAHLAYHDTLEPPGVVRPLENVTALFAPRERCYAHPLDDPSCDRNRDEYWRPLLRFEGLFPPDRRQVFEYYSDAILFKGLAPTHFTVLPGDARAYLSLDAWNVGDLMVGDRPWVGPPWHAWWTARCLWDANADARAELERFCRAAYGEAAPTMVDYYLGLEAPYLELLDLHDFQPAPRRDVLDFSDMPRRTLSLKAHELREASRGLEAAANGLPPGQGRLARERIQAEFVAAETAHLAHRLTAWDRALEGDQAGALAEVASAEAALERVRNWDEAHNSPAYAVISHRMRRGMSYQLMEIRRILEGER
jgi:hypothetical protein